MGRSLKRIIVGSDLESQKAPGNDPEAFIASIVFLVALQNQDAMFTSETNGSGDDPFEVHGPDHSWALVGSYY